MSTEKPEILNFKQVQELFGFSKSCLYKLSASGKIPHYKPTGGKLFFKRTELFEWISQKGIFIESIESETSNLDKNNDEL